MAALAFIDDKGSSEGKERGDQGRLARFRENKKGVTGHELS